MKKPQLTTAALLLFSVILTACSNISDETPEIFDALMDAEHFKINGTKIPCIDNSKFPVTEFSRLCVKMKAQTIKNEAQGGEIGLALGLELSAIFMDTDWELEPNNPDGILYQMRISDACFDKLFLELNKFGNEVDILNSNYPFQFEPVLEFHKTRKTICVKA